MFSRSCEYTLQAIIYIALHAQNNAVGLQEIAKSQNIPSHFLSKLLQILIKQKILSSAKGPNGGFTLAKPADKLTLLKIVTIIDGPDIFNKCGIGLKYCSDKTPCPIHAQYKLVKNRIQDLLSNKTLSELCKDIESGQAIVNYK